MSDACPMIPIGSIAQVRSRQYLIEQVEPPQFPGGDTQVRLVCVDDEAEVAAGKPKKESSKSRSGRKHPHHPQFRG